VSRDGASDELLRAKRLEAGLIGLRWFVVGMGVLRTAETLTTRRATPDYVLPLGFVLVAGLALGNVAVSTLTERADRIAKLRRTGAAAFVLDLVVINALVWTYTTPTNSMWVLGYILPLEGAVRFQLAGALIAAAVSVVSEPLRELYVLERFEPHVYHASAVAFRVGVELVVSMVAGLMARSLHSEAEKASERALLAEDAARQADAAAARETAARKELAAFHTAVLAGVVAGDVDSGIRSMTESIARDLGFESFAILLFDGDALVARGVHGSPGYAVGARLPLGEGILGRVAAEGVAHRLAEHADEGRGGSTEVGVPLRVGSELVGVLHKRATSGSIVPEEDLEMLSALADQIAMVVQAALLRDRQEETLRRLRELDEMKSDFVAITSHELRTPLATVRGFVNTLRRKMDRLSKEEAVEFLGIIDAQTDRLIRLVEDLLVVSRIEAGRLAFSPVPIEPAAFVEGVVRGLGEDAGRVRARVDSALAAGFAADPDRLDQVLTNLLHNALKFSAPDQSVLLSVFPEAGDVVFEVADEGEGIRKEDIARIFERFHQSEAASTRKAQGAGLGLYITKKLVEAMGGGITVTSEVGAGSTFRVRFPVTLPAPEPARRSEAAQAG